MRALLIIDFQTDFIEGSLAIKRAGAMLSLITELAREFYKNGLVVTTQDSHPYNHCSFEENGGQWPRHCVKNSWGEDFSYKFKSNVLPYVSFNIKKGERPECDSYSAFKDDGGHDTGLKNWLTEKGVDEVYIVGVALDYCVKASALHSVESGFKTYLLTDVCKGVSLQGSLSSIEEMEKAGVIITRSEVI